MDINRWQDPDELICTECGEVVRCAPPNNWTLANGPMPEFSHQDGEPLCPVVGDDGYQPSYPGVK